MKTYTKPEIVEVNYSMPSVICLSQDDDETDEALGNIRNNPVREDKDPWKGGLW